MTQRRSRWFLLAVSIVGLFGLLVFAAGLVSIWEAWEQHRSAVARREETTFQAGPLRHPEWLRPYLDRLPAPATLGSNGLRFVAKPVMEKATYAAAFRTVGGTAPIAATLIVVRELPGEVASEQRFACLLPASSYRSLTIAIDERTRDFAGDSSIGTDGTSLGFERVRGSRLFSGGGHWIEPYRGLGEIILARLREACPRAPLPEVGEDWYHREPPSTARKSSIDSGTPAMP